MTPQKILRGELHHITMTDKPIFATCDSCGAIVPVDQIMNHICKVCVPGHLAHLEPHIIKQLLYLHSRYGR